MVGNNRFLLAFHHLVIGLALVLKGMDKISHHYSLLGGLVLSFGIIILMYFFYVLSRRRLSPRLDLMIHVFEAFTSFFTAYIFFKEGATYLPYLFLLAGVGFLVAIYFTHFKGRKH